MIRRSFLHWKIITVLDLNLQRYHTNNIALFLRLNDCDVYPKQSIPLLWCHRPEITYQRCPAFAFIYNWIQTIAVAHYSSYWTSSRFKFYRKKQYHLRWMQADVRYTSGVDACCRRWTVGSISASPSIAVLMKSWEVRFSNFRCRSWSSH